MNKPSPKQIAKQLAQEPIEILKTARKQIVETPHPQQDKPQERPQQQEKKVDEQKLIAQKNRLMQAYDTELEQIRKENLFKELQRKIAQGEPVAIENFTELTPQQKDVLKAQSQTIEMQKQASKSQEKESVPQVVSKKGRKILGMFKKKSQQYVETRQPPSS